MKNPFGITTRKCKKSDYAFVYRLARQLYHYVTRFEKWDKKHFDNDFKKNYKEAVILLKGKRRIGMFKIDHQKSHTYVAQIYISPAYQRKGIGTFLMKHFEEIAKGRRKKRMRLEVWTRNPARRLYKRMGYKVIKRIGKAKHLMEKKI
jgi:ribosomal protein S18 acetylase RimI-like enzyme